MSDFELLTKRAAMELERMFSIEPYSDNLVVALGSWRANHNREALQNFIERNRQRILVIEGNFEDVMLYLKELLKSTLNEE